ncbi:GNAT family N-acetyltransferase [Thermobifida halotolerans]|uniref:GNAT family N-acetyltransferase n=1 Tax=Thermobifida halotolerans TaxID=483545 RepID=A0A399G0A4_9ACTN|nr:GNAT family N-acetyltransferase [Thermobifida halotolerans]UOE19882.1 GNAT family N-acetyltransferase [Thermobifida halotolerans]
MSTQRFVRPAREGDVEAIVDVQVAAWREMYRGALPEEVLAEMSGAEARAAFVERWRAAVAAPPTSRHRLLVATDEGTVAGFAAIGPAQDDDRWPGTDAEIYALHVAPVFARRGHGSRLLHAVVDHLLDDGFQAVYVWTLERDNPLRAFVERAGWAADGARRELDTGVLVPMVRLHAAISR